MTRLLPCLVAAISTAAFLTLWFWVVYRELSRKRDAVEIAKEQVYACRCRLQQAEGQVGDAQAILLRSEDIHRQAVARYHQSLQKPYMRLPGFLMGFRHWKEGDSL